jgi:hypothetical protein
LTTGYKLEASSATQKKQNSKNDENRENKISIRKSNIIMSDSSEELIERNFKSELKTGSDNGNEIPHKTVTSFT